MSAKKLWWSLRQHKVPLKDCKYIIWQLKKFGANPKLSNVLLRHNLYLEMSDKEYRLFHSSDDRRPLKKQHTHYNNFGITTFTGGAKGIVIPRLMSP